MSGVTVHDSLSQASVNAASPQAPGVEEAFSAPETAEDEQGGAMPPAPSRKASAGRRGTGKSVTARAQAAEVKAESRQ